MYTERMLIVETRKKTIIHILVMIININKQQLVITKILFGENIDSMNI